MDRRRFLTLGAAGVGLFAGCPGQSDSATKTPPPTETKSQMNTATATVNNRSTETPTETDTETPTETDTETQQVRDLPWTQLPGPPGGPVTDISLSKADPEWIYAAGRTAGVFASSNGGSSWIQGFSGQHHRSRIWASPHDAQTAFTKREWTDNGGQKWHHPEWSDEKRYAPTAAPSISAGGPTEADVYDLEWDRFADQTMYASTNRGFHRSVDNGQSWERLEIDIGVGVFGEGGRPIAVHPDREGHILVGFLGDHRRVVIAESTDRGDSWSIKTEFPKQSDDIRGLAFGKHEDEVYFGIEGMAVYRHDDEGLTELTSDLPSIVFPKYDEPLTLSADREKLYFIAGRSEDMYPVQEWWDDRQLYVYDMSGTGVTTVNTPVKPNAVTTHPSADSTLFVGGDSWVHKTTDGGRTWTALSDGFVDNYLSTVAINPSNPGTVFPGSMCSTGLSVSHDRGQTYQWKRSGLNTWHRGDFSEHYVMQIAAKQERAYATTEAGLLMSEDNGRTWKMLENRFSGQGKWEEPVTHLHGLAVHPSDPDIVYVGTGRGGHGPEGDAFPEAKLWKSTDGGSTWTQRTDGFPQGLDTTISDIVVNPHSPETVYLATNKVDRPPEDAPWKNADSVGLYKSTNAGRTWEDLSTPFVSAYALTVDAGDAETIYASTPTPEGHPPQPPNEGGGAVRSTDGGETWEQILPYETIGLRAHPSEPGLLFAGAQKYYEYWEVLVSQDGGDTWGEGNLRVRAYTDNWVSEKEYDATEPHSDYWGNSSGQIMWFALDEANTTVYAATNGVGLWRTDISKLSAGQ